MPAKIEMIGKTFGRLTVIGDAPRNKSRHRVYVCLCACGTRKEISGKAMRSGHTKSCGCLHREGISARNSRHGLRDTPEYRIWLHMKERTTNPNCKSYKNYGGRGIRVCDEWVDDFTAFLDYVGKRPSPNHTIERLDVNKGYEPGNVVWEPDMSVQARNRRIGIPISRLSAELGVSRVKASKLLYHARRFLSGASATKQMKDDVFVVVCKIMDVTTLETS